MIKCPKCHSKNVNMKCSENTPTYIRSDITYFKCECGHLFGERVNPPNLANRPCPHDEELILLDRKIDMSRFCRGNWKMSCWAEDDFF